MLEAREQEMRAIGPAHAELDAYLREIDWWKGWAGVEEHVPYRCRRRRGGGQADDDPEGACDALWCDGPAHEQGGAWMQALCGCASAPAGAPAPAEQWV